MHVIQRQVGRSQRRMYSPVERGVVSNSRVGNGVRYNYSGLGEVDGLFNIGKMFTRMFTFTPRSFQLKNIVGAIGSVTSTVATGGLIALAPKMQSAHSSVSRAVGYGTLAVAAVAGGAALLPAGALSIGGGGAGALTTGGIGTASSGSAVIGSVLGTGAPVAASTWTVGGVLSSIGSAIGTGLSTLTSVLPVAGMVMGGGGQQQQGGMTQAEYDAQMAAQARAQAEYDRQIAAQQQQMYIPGASSGYTDMGYTAQPASMNTSYGDLRTPYTAITEDGQTVQVDPNTGQIIPSGISTPMLVGIGAIALLAGWYFMSGSKASN